MTRAIIIAVFLLGVVLAQSGVRLEPFVPDALPETIKPNPIPEGMADNPVLPPGAVMIRKCLPSLNNLQIPTDISKAKPDQAISKRIQAIVDADQAARQKPLDSKAVLEDQKRREAQERQSRSSGNRDQQKTVWLLEKEIQDLEKRQLELTAELEKPETYEQSGRANQVNRELIEVQDQIAELTKRWEESAAKIPAMDAE